MSGEYFTSNTDDELLPVVDWDDREIDIRPRREVHLKGLLHRAAHVIVVNDLKQIVIQKRSMTKDHYPGYWDISVGGHVAPGELYIETARREIREELGVNGSEPVLVGIIPPSIKTGWEHIHVFVSTVTETVCPDSDEISECRWLEPETLFDEYSPDSQNPDRRITPSGLASIRLWWDAGALGLRRPLP